MTLYHMLNHLNHLNSMFIPYIADNGTIEVAKSLKNSSPGWDSIPANIAKPSIEYYLKPLTRLVNLKMEYFQMS